MWSTMKTDPGRSSLQDIPTRFGCSYSIILPIYSKGICVCVSVSLYMQMTTARISLPLLMKWIVSKRITQEDRTRHPRGNSNIDIG